MYTYTKVNNKRKHFKPRENAFLWNELNPSFKKYMSYSQLYPVDYNINLSKNREVFAIKLFNFQKGK